MTLAFHVFRVLTVGRCICNFCICHRYVSHRAVSTPSLMNARGQSGKEWPSVLQCLSASRLSMLCIVLSHQLMLLLMHAERNLFNNFNFDLQLSTHIHMFSVEKVSFPHLLHAYILQVINEVERAPKELRKELMKRRKEELAQSQHAQVTAAASCY